jgi:hypothetical protein
MAMTGTLGDRNPGRGRAPSSTQDNVGAADLISRVFYRRLEKCDAGVGKAIIMKQGNTRV